MTLADYTTFTAIAECKNLTLAADRLHLTKSAVSHAVARMENELGLPLFYRTQKEWILTESGEKLLPFAYSVIREDSRFTEVVREIHGLTSGRVTLGACSSTCINWVPHILTGFRELYPNIEIWMKGGANNTQIIRYLDDNEIDLGIAAAEPTPDLEVIELYEDEMLCITNQSYTARDPRHISTEELRSLPLLLQSGDFGEEALAVLAALGVPADPHYTTFDDASLVAMVSGGLGYCIVGKLVMKGISSPVNIYSFDPPQYRYLSLLYNKRIMLSPAGKALKNYIVKYIKDYPEYTL